ncbi:MAG TPA: hypothetical protein VLT33_10725 [Labilithrix sp.]|nr:hypothetical protein [Labilithrix sp.]
MKSIAPSILLIATSLACTPACSSAEESVDGQEAAATESSYEFMLDTEGLERIDAMGVALTSTALTNRDRDLANKDKKNKYQHDSPVTKLPAAVEHLITFRHFLARMHGGWAAQLDRQGFASCSKHVPLLDIEAVIPCTLQKLGTNKTADGPRVLDVVLPDWVTLSVDKPLGFPNGRILDEQVNDTVLAMGFLEMGGDCPGDHSGKARIRPYRTGEKHVAGHDSGIPICNVETFKNIQLNPPKNDRNGGVFGSEFPYLANPWFYDEAEGDARYWPTQTRKATP